MTISTEILEKLFDEFVEFIEFNDKVQFTTFNDSNYFDKEEKYKEAIYNKAKITIKNGQWKQEDVGKGKIYQTIVSTINDKASYKFKEYDNNLINNYRLKSNFGEFKHSKEFEQLLFNFYKSKGVDNETVFNELLKYGHPYNLIAYLFFIKDNNQFLPISQQKFDKIFEELGIPDFKTSGKASFENYSTFNNIVKQVRNFLKAKDNNISLLDAHSFLWIIGNQMKTENFISSRHIIVPPIENQVDILQVECKNR